MRSHGSILRTTRRLRLAMPIAGALALASPATALGHAGGRISTDYEAHVRGIQPPRPGVRARVLGGDLQLELDVTPPHVVVVVGAVGEPFLRFSPAGVQANASSPTAWSDGVVRPADAAPPGRTVWRRVAAGHTYAWHESRLRPVAVSGSRAATGGRRRVTAWTIPLVVDGRPAHLVGAEWYDPPPSVVPWIAAALALVAAGAAVARLGGRRAHAGLTAALLPVVVVAWLAGWIGILLFDHPSRLVVWLSVAYAAGTVVVVAAAITATRGNGRMVAAGTIGALAAVFTVPELAAFTGGFVLSALPAGTARAAAVMSLAGGTAVTIVSVPAMAAILRDDPLRRRLLAPARGDR